MITLNLETETNPHDALNRALEERWSAVIAATQARQEYLTAKAVLRRAEERLTEKNLGLRLAREKAYRSIRRNKLVS